MKIKKYALVINEVPHSPNLTEFDGLLNQFEEAIRKDERYRLENHGERSPNLVGLRRKSRRMLYEIYKDIRERFFYGIHHPKSKEPDFSI